MKIKDSLYTTNEYGIVYQNVDAQLSEEHAEYLRTHYNIDAKKTLHKMCVNCQARQLIKYYNQKTPQTEANEFAVRCEGVEKSIAIDKNVLDILMADKAMNKEQASLYLKSTQDPVSWCSLMFGFNDATEEWRLRPYQKEQLRCNALRLVIREGRRSGKTFIIALKLLFLVFNRTFFKGYDSEGNRIVEGPKIVIITPYQSQISNIFNEMESILKRNKDLCNQATTGTGGSMYVKTPFFRMEFQNGAAIAGFVSGVGTKVDGSGGGTIRGQNADIIYLDEMDMIPEEILDKVVIPLLLTTPNVMLIATSTPIGKRAKFFKWCQERPDFKEDYFPSTVLPQWDKIKNEVEDENSEDGFNAEYMASFIDGAHGVFKASYVYEARQDYSYEDCETATWWHEFARVPERRDLIKVIGIDWNKNAGTEFVVVAYHPGRHHWYVVESTNIAASKFSSISWKEEVIRLNYKHKPNYIYADEGYGHTIIEDLHLLGHETKGKANKDRRDLETAQLPERLVSFNFSSKVELTNPIDGLSFTKSSKEFLVENAVRIFEDNKIWYPETDETLRKQLLNYVVLRRSESTNKPIYGPENHKVGDHRLDALMLALAGLSLEFSIYSKNTAPTSKPTFIDKNTLDKRTASKQGASAFDLLMGATSQSDRNNPRTFKMDQDNFIKTVSDLKNKRIGKHRNRRGNQQSEGGILEEMMKRIGEPGERAQDPIRTEQFSKPHVVKKRSSKRRTFQRRSR